jgi:phosphopentomutase
MGTIPQTPASTLMSQVADLLQEQLVSHGHRVRRPLVSEPLLLVNEAVLIGDNLEADPGCNINLTVATDSIDFEAAVQIGRIVRSCVSVSRVIIFGGPGIDVRDMLRHVEKRGDGQIGVNSPSLGIYDQSLCVRHLGYGVDPSRQAPSIVSSMGIPVILIGKMADLIACPKAVRAPVVSTPQVMRKLIDAYKGNRHALIAATVQETDLAAHEGDLLRLASVLEQVDEGLGVLLPQVADGDSLIISADHGNDPTISVGLHTREETPLLIYRKGESGCSLGTRTTLADIGATITHLFDAQPTQDGTVMVQRRNR